MGIGNSHSTYHQEIQASGDHSYVLVSDLGFKHPNGTAVQQVMETVGKTASKVIESGGDIIAAPAVWLKDMQQNWLAYMIVVAIILSILAFFYCTVCFGFNRKKNSSSNSGLMELAKIFNNKDVTLQQQLPSSINTLRSVLSNTPTEFTV